MITDNWNLFYLILCFLFNRCFCCFSCLLLTWSNFAFKIPLPEPHVDFKMFNFNLILKLPIIINYLQSILSHQCLHSCIPVFSSGFKIQLSSFWSTSFSSPFCDSMLAAILWISENALILEWWFIWILNLCFCLSIKDIIPLSSGIYYWWWEVWN